MTPARVPTAAIVAIALGTSALLLATVSPFLPGGDAGELVTAARTLGPAHPPGYPLWVLLAHPFTRLGAVAWWTGAFSAICVAAAAGLLAFVAARVTGRLSAALIVPALAAFGPVTWTYATGAEVFALHLLLAALVACAVAEIASGRWSPFLGGLVAGLGASHHHTIVFLLGPALAVLIAHRGLRALGPAALGTLAGLVPYLLLPLSTRWDPVGAWGDHASITGLVTHVLRAEYGTLRLANANLAGSATANWAAWATHVARTTFGIGVLLAAIGGARAFTREASIERTVARWAVASLALQLTVMHAGTNLPVNDPLYRGVIERFWIVPDALVALLAALGLARVSFGHEGFARVGAGTLAVVAVATTMPSVRAQQSDAIERYGAAILDAVPEGGLLLARGDLISNAVSVAQAVEGRRPDVTTVNLELLTYVWANEAIRRRHPRVVLPGRRFHPRDGYSFRSFLDANEPRFAAIVLCGGPKPGDDSFSATWERVPAGPCERLVRAGFEESAAYETSLGQARRITVPEAAFAPGSWERIATDELANARVRSVEWLVFRLSANRSTLDWATAERDYEEAIASMPIDRVPVSAWKNLGLALGRRSPGDPAAARRLEEIWRRYLALGPKDDPDRAAMEQILGQTAAAP